MENIVEKRVNNSKKASEEGVYDINESLPNSGIDLGNKIITLCINILFNRIFTDIETCYQFA